MLTDLVRRLILRSTPMSPPFPFPSSALAYLLSSWQAVAFLVGGDGGRSPELSGRLRQPADGEVIAIFEYTPSAPRCSGWPCAYERSTINLQTLKRLNSYLSATRPHERHLLPLNWLTLVSIRPRVICICIGNRECHIVLDSYSPWHNGGNYPDSTRHSCSPNSDR
jgi:hypothetical protein